MPAYFLDTSALLKLYVEEAGSVRLAAAVSAPGVRLAISGLSMLEFKAVIRARMRGGAIASGEGERSLADFFRRATRSMIQQGLTEAVVGLANRLLDRHPLRAPDALQLASCLELHRTRQEALGQEVYLVGSDQRLLAAAKGENVPCWDPAAEEMGPG
ncbi:MAG TPA: type II toxin-antitoxin system VapC family toxin [Terriglobales bacterium]|nr:type II toxin-antitoxin system VapC family toxin [Terriglobales bacterium]